jgi:hypothetical protein
MLAHRATQANFRENRAETQKIGERLCTFTRRLVQYGMGDG